MLWLFLLISISSVLAIVSDEIYTYQFDECKLLTANISGILEIDDGEYSVISDCNKTQPNFWSCDCQNGYTFNMSFEENTFNTYTIEFNYQYERDVIEEPQEETSSDYVGKNFYRLNKGNRTVNFRYEDKFTFYSKGDRHTIKILRVYESRERIKLRVESTPQIFTLKLGETKELDMDDNGKNDFGVTLKKINSKYGGKFTFAILDETEDIKTEEPIVEDVVVEIPTEPEEPIEVKEPDEVIEANNESEIITPPSTEPQPKKAYPVWFILGIVFLIIAVILLYQKIRNKRKPKGEENENEINEQKDV